MKKRKISDKIIELAGLTESDYIKYRNDIDFNKTGLAKILDALKEESDQPVGKLEDQKLVQNRTEDTEK